MAGHLQQQLGPAVLADGMESFPLEGTRRASTRNGAWDIVRWLRLAQRETAMQSDSCDGETGPVACQDVKINTIITVKAGEVVPIDGVVVDGRTEVDESTLTGESFPVAKQSDSQVHEDLSRVKRFNAEGALEYGIIYCIVRPSRIKKEGGSSTGQKKDLRNLGLA